LFFRPKVALILFIAGMGCCSLLDDDATQRRPQLGAFDLRTWRHTKVGSGFDWRCLRDGILNEDIASFKLVEVLQSEPILRRMFSTRAIRYSIATAPLRRTLTTL
jgi:hypothetical protein